MELNLESIKKNFTTIKDIRHKVTTLFQILETHLNKLKLLYAGFIKNSQQDNNFVFGLDSFHFQSKLLDLEYEDMKRLFLAIENRMYCEYYKLYKLVEDYVKENVNDKKTNELIKANNGFPIYKDLEPFKQYKFETIQEIHESIILLLYGINEHATNKTAELTLHKKQQDIGLNINNFVTTFNYNVNMMKEKAHLFINYIEFFHSLHTKYLQRFAMKMNLFYSQITHDIRFDDTPASSATKKKEMLNDFEGQNMDKELMKQLRSSVEDSDSDTSVVSNNKQSEVILRTLSRSTSGSPPTLDLTKEPIKEPVKEPVKEGESKAKATFKKSVNKLMTGLRVFGKPKKIDEEKQAVSLNIQELGTNNNNKKDLTVSFYESAEKSEKIHVQGLLSEKLEPGERVPENKESVQNMFEELEKQCNSLISPSASFANFNEETEKKEPKLTIEIPQIEHDGELDVGLSSEDVSLVDEPILEKKDSPQFFKQEIITDTTNTTTTPDTTDNQFALQREKIIEEIKQTASVVSEEIITETVAALSPSE
jgi:hypothetical protein